MTAWVMLHELDPILIKFGVFAARIKSGTITTGTIASAGQPPCWLNDDSVFTYLFCR